MPASPDLRAQDDDDAVAQAGWLQAMGRGDRDVAVAALYDCWGAQMHRLGLRVLRDAGHAEELVQETFVRLWQSAHRFDPARGSARAFAFTIAHRVAVDHLRRAGARPRLVTAVPEGAAEESGGQAELDRVADDLVVREALATLSARHREVIELSFDEDLADRQIAERLGVPVGTVRSRTYYALRALRAELEERGLAA